MTVQAPLVLLSVLYILIAFASSSPNCDGPKAFSPSHEDQCSLYYDLLEEALVNDSDTLYQLKIAFFQMATDYDKYIYALLTSDDFDYSVDLYFDPDLYIMPELVEFDVNITVDEIPLGRNCSLYGDHPTFLNSSDGKWTAQFSLQWSQLEPTSSIQKLKYTVSRCFDVANSFDGAVGLLKVPHIPNTFCTVESERNGTTGYFPDALVSIPLHLSKLPCNPDSDVTEHVLTSLVSWAKAYARAQKIPDLWDENDKGTVLTRTGPIHHLYTINMALLVVFVFLNILAMLLMVRFIPGYYRRLPFNANDNSKEAYISIYWGLGTVSFLLAAIGTILDLTYFVMTFIALSDLDVSGFCSAANYKANHDCCHNSIDPLITAVYTRVVLTPLIFLIELLVSILTVCKKNDLCVGFSRSNTTQQFCTCSSTCSVNITCKVFHILALWGIMAFVQHITMCVIIVSFYLIDNTWIIPVVMFFASAIFCLIILTAHLFYICKVPRSLRKISALCIQLMALMVFVGLICALFGIYYNTFILPFHGIGSIAVSLIPSIALSAIGWYMKRKFLKTGENTSEEEEPNGDNPPQSVAGGQDLVEVVVDQSIDESEGEEEQTPLLHIN